MNVRELIQELQKYDGDMRVFSDLACEITRVFPGSLNYLYDDPNDQIVLISCISAKSFK